MAKKFILSAMAIAIVAALVVPASAGAVVLTSKEHPGVPIPKGTLLTGTSTDAKTTNIPEGAGGGTLECEKIMITGEVTNNSGGVAEGKGTGNNETENTTSNCTANGVGFTVTAPHMIEMKTSETGTGSVKLSFTADIGPVQCEYESHTGVFHYAAESDVIEITSTRLTAVNSELCESEEPATEPITFHGHFTLETKSDLDTVTISE